METKISVIIPVYNVEEYLRECINSVVNQTLRDIEIILIDDCSPDNSIDILKEFSAKDKRIKVIRHKKNRGIGPSRNSGVEIASGEYIFFLDSDDSLANRNVLEDLYNYAIKTHSQMIYSKSEAYTYLKDTETIERVKGLNEWLEYEPQKNYQVTIKNFQKTLCEFPCTSWGILYSKKFLIGNSLKFINATMIHEDNGFYIKCLSCMPNISFSDIKGIMYRIRKNSVTTDIDKKEYVKKKTYHMKSNLKDALSYVFKTKKRDLALEVKSLVLSSDVYNPYSQIKLLGGLIRYKWLKHDKSIRILGIEIFREKLCDKNRAIIKILGIKAKYRINNIYFINYCKLLKKFNANKHNNRPREQKVITNSTVDSILAGLADFKFLPNKGNMGDIVIAASEFQYFNSNKYVYEVFDELKTEKYTNPYNLVYGGGGLWHSLYKDDYQSILKIFKSKNLKKCVILPSSFYDCDDVISLFDERFTVFCREKQSFEYCKSLNKKAKFLLADDMVINADFDDFKSNLFDKEIFKQNFFNLTKFSLGKVYKYYSKIRENARTGLMEIGNTNIGLLMRSDDEGVINISDQYKTTDLSDYGGGYACDISLDYLLTQLFLNIIDNFEIIVTDRLHVGICAAKLGKEVYLVDNSYKKVSEVYKQSLYRYQNVHLLETKDVEILINKLEESAKFVENKLNFIDSIEDFIVQYLSIKNNYGSERRFWW